jgi:glycosyltransferase involved in cell wall biosynthesis
MSKLAISLVIITYNEAPRIGPCLDSVPFVAEKLVIDCGSTDDTVAIAQAHGARVIQQPWLGFGAQRNFASSQACHDWILVLDADERLTSRLSDELAARLPSVMVSPLCAVYLRRSLLYMGAPMRWYRPAVGEKMARLYHRQRARWNDVRVHEKLHFKGPSATMRHAFLHENNPSLLEKQLKVLRYSELKCLDWLDKKRAARMWQTPWVGIFAFIKDYIVRLGFLDGWRGYVIAQTAAAYAVYKRTRYYEMQRNPASRESAAQALLRHQLNQ